MRLWRRAPVPRVSQTGIRASLFPQKTTDLLLTVAQARRRLSPPRRSLARRCQWTEAEAAVDDELGARRVRAQQVGEEEQRGGAELVGDAFAPERDLPGQHVPLFRRHPFCERGTE